MANKLTCMCKIVGFPHEAVHSTNASFYSVCLPPVTSHIGVIGESSGGTPPRGSGSTEALPGMRNTRANRRWSQRKGSLVSSLPGSGVVRGRWSCTVVGNRRMSVNGQMIYSMTEDLIHITHAESGLSSSIQKQI